MGGDKNTATESEKQIAEVAGYKIENFEDENLVGFVATKEVEDITEKSFIHEIFQRDNIKNGEDSKINIKENLFGKTYSQNAIIDLTQMKDLKELGATITYTVYLPVKVSKTNADSISKDKKTLTWNLKLGEEQEISFKAVSRKNLFICRHNYFCFIYFGSRLYNYKKQ